MSTNGFVTAKHTVTGIVADIPQTYFKLYPGVFVEMTSDDLAQHRLELEEEKVIYALDEPVEDAPTEKAKHLSKKEGN